MSTRSTHVWRVVVTASPAGKPAPQGALRFLVPPEAAKKVRGLLEAGFECHLEQSLPIEFPSELVGEVPARRVPLPRSSQARAVLAISDPQRILGRRPGETLPEHQVRAVAELVAVERLEAARQVTDQLSTVPADRKGAA